MALHNNNLVATIRYLRQQRDLIDSDVRKTLTWMEYRLCKYLTSVSSMIVLRPLTYRDSKVRAIYIVTDDGVPRLQVHLHDRSVWHVDPLRINAVVRIRAKDSEREHGLRQEAFVIAMDTATEHKK